MKKAILIILSCLTVLLLCSCTDVTINIDGVPEDEDVPVAAQAEAGQESQQFAFGMSYEGGQGNIYSESVDGYYPAGAEIEIHAVTAEDAAFYAWTVGGYLEDGGLVVSYDKDFTFPLEADTWLYANFRDRKSALVLYHTNGGTALKAEPTVNEDGSEEPANTQEYWDEFSLAYYLYPNALPDMGYFQFDGYTLIGYSTEPDGEGEFYNVGGKIFEDADEVIELWCVWSEQDPASDFTFTFNRTYNAWFVESYNGSDAVVSIPSEYEGQAVAGVQAGAFTDNDTVETLIFPSCIKVIQDYSVNSCDNLTTLFLFDSLDYLSDASFDGDTALYTVYFGAATNPVFSNWFNNHTKKVELMNYYKDSDRPKMIILGGSSTTYAVDAEQLESLLDRDYLVLNCGSNGANLFNMTSEWAMRFLNEGDFLLQIIEYSAWQLGGVECRWESWRSFESCYNVFSWVRCSKFTKFFDSFREFLEARKAQNPSTYQDYVSNLAPNGYYGIQGTLNVVTRPNGSDTFWQGRNIYFCGDWLYDFMVYYCNVQYWKLDQQGVDYAMAYTPLNRNSLYSYQTDEAMEDFEQYLKDNLNVAVIGDLQDVIWAPAEMFDDDYHLAAPARAVYTEMLAQNLNDYFASLETDEAAGN